MKKEKAVEKKRKMSKRAVRLLIAIVAVLLISVLAVAALLFMFQSEETVVTMNQTGMTETTYAYYLSTYKYSFLVAHKNDGLTDTVRSWRSLSTDSVNTWEELFKKEFESEMTRKVTAAALFDKTYSLNAAARNEIEKRFQDIVAGSGGSQKEVNSQLKKYGCDVSDLRAALVLDYKVALLYSFLYGENGSAVSSEILEKEYQENFACVKVVFVRTKGKLQSDGTNASMTDEQLDEAARKISTLQAYLADGMNEEEFLSEAVQYLNENESFDDYPKGMFLSKNSLYDESVIELSLSLDVGEAGMVTGEYGTYLVYRYENPVGAYALKDHAVWFSGFADSVAQMQFDRLIDEKKDQVVWTFEVTDQYSVIDVPYNYQVIY